MKEVDIYRATGLTLRKLRVEAGFSQEKLALEAGISRSMIDRCERAERLPSIEILFKIGNALNIPASEILQMIENEIEP